MPCKYCNCPCIAKYKTCTKCKIEKEITEFNKMNNKGQLRGVCKACQSIRNKDFYQDMKLKNRIPVEINKRHVILYVKNGRYTILDKLIYETDPDMFDNLKYTESKGVYIPSYKNYLEFDLKYIPLSKLVTGTLYEDVDIIHKNGDQYDNRLSNLEIKYLNK